MIRPSDLTRKPAPPPCSRELLRIENQIDACLRAAKDPSRIEIPVDLQWSEPMLRQAIIAYKALGWKVYLYAENMKKFLVFRPGDPP
jgi:hypothetical protein